MSAKIITIAVKKGGAGKTATAVNLSALLARQGSKVLLLDLDEQGNAGSAFELDDNKLQDKTLEDVFEGKASIIEAISQTSLLPTLNVSLNGRQLEVVSSKIASKRATFVYALRKFLEPVLKIYDYIIIDTAPNFQPLAQAALLAADKVVVPVMDINGLDGLLDVKQLIEDAETQLGRKIELRPLYTRANQRTQAFKKLKEGVEIQHGLNPFEQPIPIDENHNKSQITLEPVAILTKPTKSFEAYMSLAEEISQ